MTQFEELIDELRDVFVPNLTEEEERLLHHMQSNKVPLVYGDDKQVHVLREKEALDIAIASKSINNILHLLSDQVQLRKNWISNLEAKIDELEDEVLGHDGDIDGIEELYEKFKELSDEDIG